MEEHFLNEWREKWLKFILEIRQNHDAKNTNAIDLIANNGNVTMNMIEKHTEVDWDLSNIAKNPNLTMDYVLAHPKLKWDWATLCEHKNMMLDMILAHPEMRKHPNHVVRNPNVTADMLKTHNYFTTEMPRGTYYNSVHAFFSGIKQCWTFADIVSNPNITMENLVELFGEKYYETFRIAICMGRMPQLDLNYVLANPTLRWDILSIIENPRIGKHLTDENIHALLKCGVPIYDVTFETLWLCKAFMYSTMREVGQILLECAKQHNKLFGVIVSGVNVLTTNGDLTMDIIQEGLDTWKNFNGIYKNELPNERWGYVWNKMNCMLLTTMYEQKSVIMHDTLIEWVIADEYILSKICVF